MKKILFSLLALFIPALSYAHDIAVPNADGVTIFYNYSEYGNELVVTYYGSMDNIMDYIAYYRNDIIIPKEVTYMNRTFKVTGIGKSAFYFCTDLTSITIPNSVTSIGEGAFSHCTGLTSVNIPNSVTSIGGSAFYGCTGLTSVNIPNSVTSIGQYAFFDCKGLTSINIPNSVTSIGEAWFQKCSGLTSVNIPNSVTSIGKGAFSGCTGLTSVNIPNSVTSIGGSAFYGCSGLATIIIPLSVTNIESGVFYGCTGLTSITIPNYVMSIGSFAFYNCSGLSSVTIPNSVKSIGDEAFQGCYFLKSNFTNNSNLTDGSPWGATFYDEETNEGLLLTNNSVIKCRPWATLVTIPNSVTSIGEGAFSHCTGLTSITIPNSVTSIGRNAFTDCTSLTSITIPNSVTSIEYGAFDNTAWYNNQPDGLVYAGKIAYKYKGRMPSNTSITIKEGTLAITGFAFCNCSGLISITIPNSVKSIGVSAFSDCTGLTSITIPNSVTSIEWYAFSYCTGLTSVTIGNSVTSIGGHAFDYADISTVISLIKNPFAIPGSSSYDGIFSQNTFFNATLYVPKGTIEKYKATEGWEDFCYFEELSGEGGDPPTLKYCAKPTISYSNGQLKFDCETEGVEYHSSITDTDIKDYTAGVIDLSVTYNIRVYATKEGYENSEVATATLCWIDAEPSAVGTKEAEDNVTEVKAIPVLIQAEGNIISVQGAAEGTDISVYNTDGMKLNSAIANKGITTLNTQLPLGSTAIVKIGGKAVKVLVK